jgi:hypothetical protein
MIQTPTRPATPVAKPAPKPAVPVAKPAPKSAVPVAKPAPKPLPPAPEVPPEPESEPVAATNGKREFANEARLTVHLQQPMMRVTVDGRPWATARAFVSMGKAKDSDEYKPPLWLTVKAFTTKDGDDTLPNTLNGFEKGAIATVAGRLAYEEYTTPEGETRGSLVLIANAIEF